MNRLSRAAATARDTQPQARPGLAEADLLIRNLESQMRRQRDGGMTGPEFSAGLRRWAERFRLALPEFASEAEEIATTFSGDDDHLGTSMRLERIGTAMRLLARLRSHMAGETPRQVMLPGASGPPPEAVPSASSVCAGSWTAERRVAPSGASPFKVDSQRTNAIGAYAANNV